jgi:pyruvate/2-oxoacid:ferredoxin oxidoreductase alpha subunit
MEQNEIRYEDYAVDDADIILIGYGVVSRVLQSVVDILRREGVKIGMMRPISLFPFPTEHIKTLTQQVNQFIVVELSNGQMVDDVRLAVNGKKPVGFYGRMGGVVPTTEEIIEHVRQQTGA